MRPPAAAAEIYGERLPIAQRYAEWLAVAGIERGLLGPREVSRLWDRHLLNCVVISELIGRSKLVADVGAGAGLPGIALAIARPDLRLVLIEPMLRRADFLRETVALLGLQSVDVVRSRAEEYRAPEPFDVVTARAVAKIGQLFRWSVPLLRPGGRLLALKGESVRDELRTAADDLRKAGASSWSVESVGRNVVDPATLVAVVTLGR
ncbi:16S rRNA (guanine(527)-N(7))-methyltransferase RsmG [Phytoactinopolyspora limicola]|uniref:16S rRNA (guanine(527)-N(7))-methyltransferase RsmG n=1 Tax=Phytoactinopolyspora limicola TaxID=2715536 RepID=UPI001A9C6819|nr:16S rRNA (guanine(527)-N(7))-methyltransferase RsmG [Phytoactinopolyspora limicola]